MNDMNEANQKGFTLIEILIAMTIFAFGILAVGLMQITAIRGNSFARGMTEASNIAQNKVEELVALPFNHLQLNEQTLDGDAGLDSPTMANVIVAGPALIPAGGGGPDHAQQISPDGGGNYYLYWNVSPGANVSAGADSRNIRVIVAWDERGMHRLDLGYIKNP